MLDGWSKADPPTVKKLPVEVDIPEFLANVGRCEGASEKDRAVGDLALIAFYYLLRVGEYTKKAARNETKQTIPFMCGDVFFFLRSGDGFLRLLPNGTDDDTLMGAAGSTLKLGNQKNGWKNVCLYQQANEKGFFNPTTAIARRYCHIRTNVAQGDFATTPLSAYFVKGVRHDVSDRDMSAALKVAAACLDYHGRKGIPVDRVDTHSLRGGGANALALAGYSDTQIQKMGRWRGDTFKEYIRENLACFSEGMSKAMGQTFNFMNVEGGATTDITNAVVAMPYAVNVAAAAA